MNRDELTLKAISAFNAHGVDGLTRQINEVINVVLTESAELVIDNQDCDPWEISAILRAMRMHSNDT